MLLYLPLQNRRYQCVQDDSRQRASVGKDCQDGCDNSKGTHWSLLLPSQAPSCSRSPGTLHSRATETAAARRRILLSRYREIEKRTEAANCFRTCLKSFLVCRSVICSCRAHITHRLWSFFFFPFSEIWVHLVLLFFNLNNKVQSIIIVAYVHKAILD